MLARDDEKNGSSRKTASSARRRSARRRSRARAPRDAFVPASSGLGEEETNLGSLLKRALASEQAASSRKAAASSESEQEQHCADCWHAVTFTDERGNTMVRCEKNLWVRPVYSYKELNRDRVRRWHAVCPEYDDGD